MRVRREMMDVIAEKFTFAFSDFDNVGDTSAVLNLGYRGNNIYLLGAFGRVITAFVTGTAPQLKLGYPSYEDYLIPLQSIATVGQLKSGKRHQLFCQGMAHPTAQAEPIKLTIQNDTGNLQDYTAGEFEIVIVYAGLKV